MNYIATSLKFRKRILLLFFVMSSFAMSSFADVKYNGNSKSIELECVELECVDFGEKYFEFKSATTIFIESEISISSANLNYDNKHYSRTKKSNIVITTLNLFRTMANSSGLMMNPKVELFILYSSLKLPSPSSFK